MAKNMNFYVSSFAWQNLKVASSATLVFHSCLFCLQWPISRLITILTVFLFLLSRSLVNLGSCYSMNCFSILVLVIFATNPCIFYVSIHWCHFWFLILDFVICDVVMPKDGTAPKNGLGEPHLTITFATSFLWHNLPTFLLLKIKSEELPKV